MLEKRHQFGVVIIFNYICKMKLQVARNQKVWFTSDTHYGHSNICRATSNWPDEGKTRDFESLDKMNASIVNAINNNVGPDDILFHLGDWSFGGFERIAELRHRIMCQNIHLVLGNHDHHIDRNKEGIQSLFASVNKYHYLTLKVDKGGSHDVHRMVLCHFPIASWHDLNQGVIHLHGHVHLPAHLKFGPGKMMDVGMDGSHGMEPYELKDILKLMEKREKRSMIAYDHHE
jgi:calcineurin-like phosphoesterase family protein